MTITASSQGLAASLPASQRRADVQTISLIGLAHGTSHFFHMLLPPLFPVFGVAFGLSWTQLGLLVTVFYAVSGVGQALAGFVVDRHGARPALFAALLCFAGASVAAGLAQGYGGLLLAAALAGLGNSPFHPADFTILNQRVSPPRLGHAFSVHGISGNLGWAAAPVFALAVLQTTGNWRWVYVGTALVALAVLALLVWQRAAIEDEPAHKAAATSAAAAPAFGFLKLPSVWLCFSFFFFTTGALAAIQTFAGPALAELHRVDKTHTALLVTGYMVCGAVGMLIGGFWVARAARLERNIAMALGASMLLLALSVADPWPLWLALALVMLAGVGTGLAGPARDMLVKRAAPPGATGRVYGTVYSGLDIGFALAAPVFGAVMDRHWPMGVLLGSAALLGLALATAQAVAWFTARSGQRSGAA